MPRATAYYVPDGTATFVKFKGSSTSPVVDPATGTASSISQHGITFTFDKAYPAGQFVNGDWWVTPDTPGGTVIVTEITPAYVGTLDAEMNGWEVNPSSGSRHGMDGRKLAGFDPTLVPALPYTASANQSLVKALSEAEPYGDGATGHKSSLATVVVLTVLDSAPPADAFRPPYFGVEKPLFLQSQLIQANLPSLAVPAGQTPPSLDGIVSRFDRVQYDPRNNWQGRYYHPNINFGTSQYGASLTRDNNRAMLRLMLNDVTWDQKLPALIRVIQAGLDWYGVTKGGGKKQPDGGHNSGRLSPQVFAACMFGTGTGQPGKAIADTLATASTDQTALGEFGHFWYSSVAATNGVAGGYLYGRYEDSTGDYWKRLETGSGKRDLRDPTGQIDGGDGASYHEIISAGLTSSALIARLMPGGTAAWSHAASLGYIDRWRSFGKWMQPDTEYPGRRTKFWDLHGTRGTESYLSSFEKAMWDTHRSSVP